VSIACIVAAVAIAVQIGLFFHSSSAGGAALIHRERRSIAAAIAAVDGRGKRTPCRSPAVADVLTAPRGLLESPTLGLVAPVVEGTGDAVLADAVGHVAGSAWPGHAGTSVFAAHDVTWFSGIDRLKPGDEIRYVTPCHSYSYRVTSHRVVPAGYPVYNTAVPSIVLDTCYPLNALYFTSTRYLVYATLNTISRNSGSPAPTSASSPPRPASPPLTVPAPEALVAQGLDLDQNVGPLGILGFAGSPSRRWSETSAPLTAERTVLTEYFGVIHSAGQGERTWWADLAPSVPAAAAAGLWSSMITGYDAPIDVTLRVHGDQVLGAVLTTAITTRHSAKPRIYDLTVAETVTGTGTLVVTGFTMQPAG
jgi:sortase A